MDAHVSPNASAPTPLANPTRLSLTNDDDTLQFLTNSIAGPVINIDSNPFTNRHAFYQHLQQPSACIQQDLYQQCSMSKQHFDSATSSSPLSSNCGNEFSPVSSHATRTPNSTNSTPLSSHGNTSVCAPPLSSNTSLMPLSKSNPAPSLQQGHHENASTLSGTPDSWGFTSNDEQYAIHLSADQRNFSITTDINPHLVTGNEQHIQTQMQLNHNHQLQQFMAATGESGLKSQMLCSGTSSLLSSSSQETNKDRTISANQSSPADQQTIQSTFSDQSKSTVPDPYKNTVSSEMINGKRPNTDHMGRNTTIGTPYLKKAKHDETSQQQSGRNTETTMPTSTPRLTAATLQNMTREQLVDRLIIMENERIDLLKQLEHRTKMINVSRDSRLASETAGNSMIDKNNKTCTGGDDDEDDEDEDEDEEVEGVSNVANANLDDTNNSNVEMKCLWKDCGIMCIGGAGLTDHIIATHIGGGKSIYPCEWENCRRNQKPFTKRHKLCNHLRTHSGERPFVCDKAGCDKRFSRPDSLITHIKTHSTVRSFVCHIPACGKAYYHIRSLKKHLKLHKDENTNENGGSTLDSNKNTSITLSTTYPSNIAIAPTGIQPTQQQQHLYPLQEQVALTQFALQPTLNTMHSKPLPDPSLYDSSQSLFDPLTFQGLPPQQQFMQMDSTSQMQIPAPMPNTNTNINMMDQPNALIQHPPPPPPQQQQQQQQQQQNEYSIPLFL